MCTKLEWKHVLCQSTAVSTSGQWSWEVGSCQPPLGAHWAFFPEAPGNLPPHPWGLDHPVPTWSIPSKSCLPEVRMGTTHTARLWDYASCLGNAAGTHIWLCAPLGVVSEPWEARWSFLAMGLYLWLFPQLLSQWDGMGMGTGTMCLKPRLLNWESAEFIILMGGKMETI